MKGKRRAWPSRRLQAGILVALALAAAWRVFVPPFDRQQRAEQLYTDSWFPGTDALSAALDGETGDERAAGKAEAAVKLVPGNTLYEQALVWHTRREKLPALLRERKLGPEARALAAGLIYEYETRPTMEMPPPPTGSAPGATGEIPEPRMKPEMPAGAKLARLKGLEKEDPSNALPHYLKANLLSSLRRYDEVLAEVEAGNRLGRLRLYQPPVSPAAQGSITFVARQSADCFPQYARFREVARALGDIGSRNLRRGRVDEARRALEACCRMGILVASSEPRMLVTVMVGKAIFAMGWVSLEPLYKDFGPADALARQRRVDQAFEHGLTQSRAYVESGRSMELLIKGVTQAYALPAFIACAGGISLALALLSLLLWIPAARARKRREEPPILVAPWGEGWVARVCLASYVPATGAVLLVAYLLPEELSSTVAFVWPGMMVIGVLPLLAVVGLALRAIRRGCEQHTGERMGFFRWLFKAPAAPKAWTRRWLAAACAGQALFVAGAFLLLLFFYKPVYGGHPWQGTRFTYGTMAEEQAIVGKIIEDLRAAERNQGP